MTSLKERVITGIVNKFFRIANEKADVAELQRKFKGKDDNIMEMRVLGINRSWYARIHEGRVEFLTTPDPSKVLGGFTIQSDAIIGLAMGKRKYQNPATGEEFEQPYTPMDAVTQGEVDLWGEGAMNDMLLVAKAIYREVRDKLQDELASAVQANGDGGPQALGALDA